jgi:hypothetical protein
MKTDNNRIKTYGTFVNTDGGPVALSGQQIIMQALRADAERVFDIITQNNTKLFSK